MAVILSPAVKVFKLSKHLHQFDQKACLFIYLHVFFAFLNMLSLSKYKLNRLLTHFVK